MSNFWKTLLDNVTHWTTTVPAGVVAVVTYLLAHSGIIPADQVNSVAGDLIQGIAYFASVVAILFFGSSGATPPAA